MAVHGPRDGRVMSDDDSRATVVEVLVSHGLATLATLVDKGSGATSRESLVWMLDALAVLCARGWETASSYPSYAPIIWYERVRLCWTSRDFFLDGVPACLPLFGAPTALEFPVTQMRDLTCEDAVDDRIETIKKLEGMAPGSAKRAQLASTLDQLRDMVGAVPMPVRMFVSRTRSMCQGLRASKAATLFSQCQNDTCCRLFYRGERVCFETGCLPCSIDETELGYWAACSPLPSYDAPAKRFCTRACAEQWRMHWDRLMPDADIAYGADVRSGTENRRQVSRAFDRAIERNGRAGRAIRKRLRRYASLCRAVSRPDANREFEARLDMLNVDTGLLYAAQIVAKLPRLAQRRRLPGSYSQWRHGGEESHRNALIRVARIYRQHPASEPISDLLDLHPFLRAIRNNASAIF